MREYYGLKRHKTEVQAAFIVGTIVLIAINFFIATIIWPKPSLAPVMFIFVTVPIEWLVINSVIVVVQYIIDLFKLVDSLYNFIETQRTGRRSFLRLNGVSFTPTYQGSSSNSSLENLESKLDLILDEIESLKTKY